MKQILLHHLDQEEDLGKNSICTADRCSEEEEHLVADSVYKKSLFRGSNPTDLKSILTLILCKHEQ